jgi:S-adenosylmethionine:diacylglycerol 3-amino-3-carboxypropyl transferase
MGFRDQLQYSSCSEDTNSEWMASQVMPDAPILAVAGGGGRAFGLLGGSRRIQAFDFNQSQIQFCKFKSAAIRCLNYEEFSLLMGLRGSGAQRKELLRNFPQLAQMMTGFSLRVRWRMIRFGALFCGRVEEHFVFGGRLLNRIYPKQMQELLSASEPGQRVRIWKDLNAKGLWSWLARQGSSPWVYKFFLQNIGWYNQLPEDFDVSRFVLGRIEAHLERYSVLDSHVLQLVLYGRYFPEYNATLPTYLTHDFYAALQTRMDQVEFVCSDVVSFVEQLRESSPVFFSLSNVPAYLNPADFDRMWLALAQKCPSGSIIVGRHFLRKQQLPAAVANQFRPLRDLTASLNQQDRSFVYDLYAYERSSG